jgi:hypothetical protein
MRLEIGCWNGSKLKVVGSVSFEIRSVRSRRGEGQKRLSKRVFLGEKEEWMMRKALPSTPFGRCWLSPVR